MLSQQLTAERRDCLTDGDAAGKQSETVAPEGSCGTNYRRDTKI